MTLHAGKTFPRLNHFPAQLFGGDPTGLPAPQIDGQLPRHRHNGLFAFAGVTAGLQQNVFPLLDGFALGLELDHAPGQFEQQISESGVAVFGDAQVQMALAAGTDPAAQTAEGTDLTAIGEALPVAHFILGGGQRQRPATEGPELGRLLLDGGGQRVELFLHGVKHGAIELQPFAQPAGELFEQLGPLTVVPPIAQLTVMSLGEHQAFAHGVEPLAFAAELFALPADTAALFFLRRGDADDGEGFGVSGEVTIQPTDQFGGIGFVGVDPFAEGVEFHGADDEASDAPGGELAGQTETARTGFVDGIDFIGQGELLFDERCERGARIDPLRWLRARAVELADDPQVLGMLIDAEEQPVARWFYRLRGVGGCGEVSLLLGMRVGLHIKPLVNGLVGPRILFRPHFKLPLVAALANTHAILGR